MARLEVNFELVSPNAFAQGQEAGRKYADGFYQAFASHGGAEAKTSGGGGSLPGLKPEQWAALMSDGGFTRRERRDERNEQAQQFTGINDAIVKWTDELTGSIIGLNHRVGESVQYLELFNAKLAGLKGGESGNQNNAYRPPAIGAETGGGAEIAGEAEALGGAEAVAPEFTPLIAVAAAGVVAFDGLKHVAEELWNNFKELIDPVRGLADAFQNAKKSYATATTSGFGLQMGTQRTSLAQIIGVGENEVWQYASAFNYLNDKLKWSSGVLAETSPTLTKVGYDFGVFKKDLEAMWAVVAAKLSPAIDGLIKWLDKLTRSFTEFMEHIEKSTMTMFSGILSAMSKVFLEISKALQYLNLGWLANELQKGAVGLQLAANKAKNYKEGQSESELGRPSAFIRQFPASAWERMGLVIGGGAGTNYAQQTAQHTKRSADLNQKIYDLLNKMNGHPQGMKLPQTYPARP